MSETKRKKQIILIVLMIAIILMSIAFASSSTTLTIKGIAVLDPELAGIELSQKTSIWFGDSIMAGDGNTRKVTNAFGQETTASFPDYYRDITNAELSKTINCGVGGSTISANTPYLSIESYINHFASQEAIASIAKEIELVVLDGGGNDVIAYALGGIEETLKKEIGSSSNTTADTVVNDFRKILTTIKEKFPNAKILYVHPISLNETAIEIMGIRAMFPNKTLEQINQENNTNFKTMQEVREFVFENPQNASAFAEVREKINDMKSRASALYQEIPKICKELGVNYLDLSGLVEENRASDGSDSNSYIQADGIHMTDVGYTALTPTLVNKVKEMFK